MHLVGIPHAKLLTKFEICSSNNCHKFWGSRDLGHAPFGENYWRARSAFPRWTCTPNLKFLAQVVLKICSIVCQKF